MIFTTQRSFSTLGGSVLGLKETTQIKINRNICTIEQVRPGREASCVESQDEIKIIIMIKLSFPG
jgi:hypothetical protein